MAIISIGEPGPAAAPPVGFALWQLGFRPFYLLAGGFAAFSIVLWVAQVSGWLARPYLAGAIWHAHEMVFGYTLAVVVGFLFTAGQNWAGLPTPHGPRLIALAGLWLAGRVLVLTPYGWLAAVVNVAFPVAAAVALALPFWKARNRRNYFFPVLMLLIAVAQLAVHLSQLGVLASAGWPGIQAALDVVLFIMVVMSGRVIPMFTNNGVPGAGARNNSTLEWLAKASVLALLAVDLLAGSLLAPVALVAAAIHLARWLLWRPWTTLRAPLVWVLHAAYAWIPVHLALRGFAQLGWVPANLAMHALTVGAIGGLTIGMMTRTARGHTGRLLRADRWEVLAYLSIIGAALVRVAGPLLAPSSYLTILQVSALLWACGFAVYTIRYWPILARPRLDGKPG